LLDSLMGGARDASLEEAEKSKGKQFTVDNVCKPYLLGFCPQHELSNSKLVTKRKLGECRKVHSDAMKKEYETSPDKATYRAKYEKQFLPFLESQIREADAWVSRERANVQKTASQYENEKTTISSMPDSVRDQIESMTKDMNKMMASAEDCAESGDIEGSRFKVELSEEIKERITELQDAHPDYTVNLREEWVCDVCGTRTEAVTEKNTARFQAHFTGKVHLGYAKIREWVRDIRKRQRDASVVRLKKEEEQDKDDQRRRHSRSRDKKVRETEKEKEKEKETEKDEEADTDRRRRRSRSREGRKDRDRDRRDRDRDGDRRRR